MIDFADGTIVGDDGEAFVVHVEDEVLALDGEIKCPEQTVECDPLTMTARPMRPISPLEEGGEQREAMGEGEGRTLEPTSLVGG